jgi:orotidine-5'-phosphate decarboxylase
VAERDSQIVLGLDPDPSSLWPGADPAGGNPAERASEAVARHCCTLIDAAGSACVAVKLQLARFEALGPLGAAAARLVAAHARAAGLLVIADGKRGDIDVTAAAYAASLGSGVDTPYGHVAGLEADLVTVNPLMGRDALAPFVDAARARGAGVLVLVRTSNPGAADLFDARLASGEALWERVARIVHELGSPGTGEAGISDIGAVIGATEPMHLLRARELMPNTPFLLPGVGAQGGRVEELAPAFAIGRAGGLVSASRSIAEAHRSAGGDPAAAAGDEAQRLRRRARELCETAAGAR